MILTTSYDNELVNFTYLPWIGAQFDSSRIQIIGDSHYDDGDGWLHGNKYATRQLIYEKGLHSETAKNSKAQFLRIVEKVVSNHSVASPDEKASFWNKVSFLNLSQRLLPSIKQRPTDADFDFGWEVFLKFALILKPTICIKLGIDGIGRLGHYLNNTNTAWIRNVKEFYTKPFVINLINGSYHLKIVVINHPTGSRGFDSSKWTDLIHREFPGLEKMFKDKDTTASSSAFKTQAQDV